MIKDLLVKSIICGLESMNEEIFLILEYTGEERHLLPRVYEARNTEAADKIVYC
jgi:hypothetical protein